MNLGTLQTYIAQKCNDPSNARYTLAMINTELDNVQNRWNLEAGICRTVVSVTLTAGVSTYALSLLGTPIRILRVTLNGIDLHKRSKDYFDLYSATDWTLDNGTPLDYYLDLNNTAQTLGVHPTPQAADVVNPLKIEYVLQHTSMVNPTDTPFMVGAVSNVILTPYHYGLGLESAANLLSQDPTEDNMGRISMYMNGDAKRGVTGANEVLSQLIEEYGTLDLDQPWRMSGGRYWQY